MKNISNTLSLFRLLLLPLFIWQFLCGGMENATALLVLSGVMYLLQGAFAGRLHTSTYVSLMLGPAVDKLTRVFAAILLAFRYPACWWVFLVVMGKELLVLALGAFLMMNDIRSRIAMWSEKICSLLFYIAVTPLMLHLDVPAWLPQAARGLVAASAVFAVLCYLPDVIFVIRRRHEERMRKLGRKSKKGIKPYGVFAMGIIPLCTIAFAGKGDPLAVNLSIIGNQPGHRVWFILWGVLCAVYFVSLFIKTFHVAMYRGKIERSLMIAAGVSFIACVLTPFLPERYPVAARWHNVLAVMASALIILVSLLLSLYLRKINRGLHHKAMLLWGIITCACAFLILATGISGLFEVSLIISVSLHTYYILACLTREASMRQQTTDSP